MAIGATFLNLFSNGKAPIRGGVEVGVGVEMFDHEYYGHALVDAYVMESRGADYPRVLVGQRLLGYLAAMERGPFKSARLHAHARSFVAVSRQMLVKDPDDGLLAIDPLGMLLETPDPHRSDYIVMARAFLQHAKERAEHFRSEGDYKLAVRYERLARLVLASRHAKFL